MKCTLNQCHKTLISFHLIMILPIVRSIPRELVQWTNVPGQMFYQNSIQKRFYEYLHFNRYMTTRKFGTRVATQSVDPNKWQVKKRPRMDLVAAKPACPYTTEWKLIYQARDINDTEVTVYQPDDGTENGLQWFYTATCDRAQIYRENPHCTNCCRGIDQNRFTSNCIPKKSYVMAYVKRREQSQYEWDWIQINTGCSCAVSNRHH